VALGWGGGGEGRLKNKVPNEKLRNLGSRDFAGDPDDKINVTGHIISNHKCPLNTTD